LNGESSEPHFQRRINTDFGGVIERGRLDRIGRNMEEMIMIVNILNNRGASFHSLQENITMDKSSSTGQLFFY
jgi:DNA invertase Pin-like site-specific DNA recombinase